MPDAEAHAAWDAAKAELERTLHRSDLVHVRVLEPRELVPTGEASVLRLAAPTTFHAEWTAKHLAHQIAAALTAAGHPCDGIEVRHDPALQVAEADVAREPEQLELGVEAEPGGLASPSLHELSGDALVEAQRRLWAVPHVDPEAESAERAVLGYTRADYRKGGALQCDGWNDAALRTLVEWCDTEPVPPPQGVVLVGMTGRGKTTAALAFAWHRRAVEGEDVRCVRASRFQETEDAYYRDRSATVAPIKALRGCDVLLLDDLTSGVDRHLPSQRTQFSRLLKDHLDAGRELLLTLNVHDDREADRLPRVLGEYLTPETVDRIFAACAIAVFRGPSRRHAHA